MKGTPPAPTPDQPLADPRLDAGNGRAPAPSADHKQGTARAPSAPGLQPPVGHPHRPPDQCPTPPAAAIPSELDRHPGHSSPVTYGYHRMCARAVVLTDPIWGEPVGDRQPASVGTVGRASAADPNPATVRPDWSDASGLFRVSARRSRLEQPGRKAAVLRK